MSPNTCTRYWHTVGPCRFPVNQVVIELSAWVKGYRTSFRSLWDEKSRKRCQESKRILTCHPSPETVSSWECPGSYSLYCAWTRRIPPNHSMEMLDAVAPSWAITCTNIPELSCFSEFRASTGMQKILIKIERQLMKIQLETLGILWSYFLQSNPVPSYIQLAYL